MCEKLVAIVIAFAFVIGILSTIDMAIQLWVDKK